MIQLVRIGDVGAADGEPEEREEPEERDDRAPPDHSSPRIPSDGRIGNVVTD